MTLPYGAVVLEHFRHPRNHRPLENATASHEAFNPLCGDRVRIELDVDQGKVRDAAFTANACVICIAAASLLTEQVRGMELGRIVSITDGDVLATLGTNVPRARVSCAVLPLSALRSALQAAAPTSA